MSAELAGLIAAILVGVSFCARPHGECDKLIAGHNDVAICDECIEVCHQIIHGGDPGFTSVTEEYSGDATKGTQE